MSRLAEQYLDLFESFEPRFTLNHRRGSRLEIATPGARR